MKSWGNHYLFPSDAQPLCCLSLLSGLNAGRVMEYILKLFGITDVTCKAIGRRNPYSVVMATFNALKTHRVCHTLYDDASQPTNHKGSKRT